MSCLSTGKLDLITAGMTIIMMEVKTRERPTESVSSSFLALQAAAVAMAAETPQTLMSEQMVALRRLDWILRTFWPNQ